jgi:hypothetical protein
VAEVAVVSVWAKAKGWASALATVWVSAMATVSANRWSVG